MPFDLNTLLRGARAMVEALCAWLGALFHGIADLLGEMASDPVALATLALALVTGLLGFFTFSLVRETRNARLDLISSRDQEQLRHALIELGDVIRDWLRAVPMAGSTAFGALDMTIDLRSTRHALAVVTVPGDLLAYLLWSANAVPNLLAAYQDLLEQNSAGQLGWATERAQDLYAVTLDQLLTMARLLIAESTRRGFQDIPNAFAPQFAYRSNRTPSWSELPLGRHGVSAPPQLPKVASLVPAVPALAVVMDPAPTFGQQADTT
jgi:hypothetical protein